MVLAVTVHTGVQTVHVCTCCTAVPAVPAVPAVLLDVPVLHAGHIKTETPKRTTCVCRGEG